MHYFNEHAMIFLKNTLGLSIEGYTHFHDTFFALASMYCPDILMNEWIIKETLNQADYLAPRVALETNVKMPHKRQSRTAVSDTAGFIITYKSAMLMHPSISHVELRIALDDWCAALRGAIEVHPEKEMIRWSLS